MPDRDKKLTPFGRIRRVFFGRPIPTALAHHERLGPILGLPVFSSDALSSVAYATEAILGVLVLYSVAFLQHQLLISAMIVLLIWIVALSYNQTIHAYPSGGGSYIVATENLGETPGLLAAASLLIDYVLTVSVSVAAGVAAIASAFPESIIKNHIVALSIVLVLLVMWANLRGLKESGTVFAVPTYGFIVSMVLLILVGAIKATHTPVILNPVLTALEDGKNVIGKELNYAQLFIILRAFAAGCTALTGIEAVSNGVQAFKAPEADNASKTLKWMAALLALMFLGTGILVRHLPDITLYDSGKTLVSQLAAWTFGYKTPLFYVVQVFTALILILAANTSFADFPRLASLIARDGYLPRPLARQGDRLVFHNGIIILSAFACSLIWYFQGQLDNLLPLYAVGVFTAFTLSQTGMVVHWFRLKDRGWHTRAVINGVGAVATFVVTIIILVTKFAEGAWIVAILVPFMYLGFRAIKRRYDEMSRQLSLDLGAPTTPTNHTSLILVPRVHRGILSALDYALLMGLDCKAVHVAIDKKALPNITHDWETYGKGVPMVVLKSPYRSLMQPVLDYIDKLQRENPDQVITVIVPEAVSQRTIHRLLQENVATQLKKALGERDHVVVTNVRYFLE
ncbi:MAG: APC family permease [Armatimonadetes bacterium]|nr:APC family permease [Armatimonadota bacterium]